MSVTRLSNAKGLCHVGCGRGMWPLLLNLNTELGAGRTSTKHGHRRDDWRDRMKPG